MVCKTQNQAGNHAGSSPASGTELFLKPLILLYFQGFHFFKISCGAFMGQKFLFAKEKDASVEEQTKMEIYIGSTLQDRQIPGSVK